MSGTTTTTSSTSYTSRVTPSTATSYTSSVQPTVTSLSSYGAPTTSTTTTSRSTGIPSTSTTTTRNYQSVGPSSSTTTHSSSEVDHKAQKKADEVAALERHQMNYLTQAQPPSSTVTSRFDPPSSTTTTVSSSRISSSPPNSAPNSSQVLKMNELTSEIDQLRGENGVQSHEIRFLRSRVEHLQEVADEAVAERDKVRKDTSSRSGDMAATLNQQILAQKQEIALLKTENERLRSDAARARPAPAPCAECAKRHDNMAKRADNLTAKSNVGSTQSSFRSVSPGMQRPGASRAAARGTDSTTTTTTTSPQALGSSLGVGRSSGWSTRTARAQPSVDGSLNSNLSIEDEKARYRQLEQQVREMREKTPPRERAKLDGLLNKLSGLHSNLDGMSEASGSRLSSPAGSRSASRSNSRPMTPETRRRMTLTAADLADEKRRTELLRAKMQLVRDKTPVKERARLDALTSKLESLGSLHSNMETEASHLRDENRARFRPTPSQEM